MARKIDTFAFFEPHDRDDWRTWLANNHLECDGVWLVYYKKKSGHRNILYDEAVEEALCFGWIDSLPRALDRERSLLLFTPRKDKSVWSEANKNRVERLLTEGSMAEAGIRKVDIAKRNGSWDALNRSDRLELPEDLLSALASDTGAQTKFLGFSPSVQKNILAWIFSAKRPETRKRRIAETVRLAGNGLKAGPYAVGKPK